MVLLNSEKRCLYALDGPQMLQSAHSARDHITHPMTQELRLEEAALDSATHCVSPQWSHSTSTPQTPRDDYRSLVSASVCVAGGRKGSALWRKGSGKSKGHKERKRNPAPVPLSVHSSLLLSLHIEYKSDYHNDNSWHSQSIYDMVSSPLSALC